MGESRPEILPRVLSGTFDDRFSTVAFIGGGKMYRLARERLGTISDVLVKETPFGCSTPILFAARVQQKSSPERTQGKICLN